MVEIDIIALQSFEAVIQGKLYVLFIQTVLAIAEIFGPLGVGCHLGGNNQLITILALCKPGSEDSFSPALGFGLRRNRVHFGRINKIDSLVDGVIELFVAFQLCVLFAPGHGTQANLADSETRTAKFPEFHADVRLL